MRCPYCSAPDSKVVNSRPSDDGASIRRRRECLNCARRFTTYERAQLEPLMVVKRSGVREAFNPDKLLRGLSLGGVRWPLEHADIPLGSGWTVSNEAQGCTVTASLREGRALVTLLPTLPE